MYQSSGSLMAMDNENMYEVEKIIDMKIVRGKKKYLVKWKFWDDPKDLTWEPKQNLETVKDLLNQFEKHYQKNSHQMEIQNSALPKIKETKLRKKQRVTTKKPILSNKMKDQNQDSSSSSSSSSQSSSSSSSSSEKIKIAKKIPIKMQRQQIIYKKQPQIQHINYFLIKANQLYADCDLVNQNKQCIGASLISVENIRKKNPIMLTNFLQNYLVNIAEMSIGK